MATFAEKLMEERRLHILRLLRGLGGETNPHILCVGLRDYQIKVSEDVVRADLAWLEEVGLVRTDVLRAAAGVSVMVATLTRRGAEVAEGVTTVPGVKRPDPWEV